MLLEMCWFGGDWGNICFSTKKFELPLHLSLLRLKKENEYVFSFYAPNFGEVEGAYWFGPVPPSVCLSVTLGS